MKYPRWKHANRWSDLYYVHRNRWIYEVNGPPGEVGRFTAHGPDDLGEFPTRTQAKEAAEAHFQAHRNQYAEQWGIMPTEEVDSGISVPEWKQRVLDLCQDKGGGVSFAEIARLPGAKGVHVVRAGDRENVIYWCDLQKALTKAIEELVAADQIIARGTSALVYLIDGCVLSFPLAKQKRSYRTLHWQPVTFSFPELEKCRRRAEKALEAAAEKIFGPAEEEAA
jgi:hypothetical protein